LKTKQALLILPVLGLAACATIIHGPRQDVPVNTVPSGVTVEVLGRTYTTPATIELKRTDLPVTLKFSKEGYETLEFTLNKTVDGWILGNIIFGGIPGLIVDLATGSTQKIVPGTVQVTLKESQALIRLEISPDGGLNLHI